MGKWAGALLVAIGLICLSVVVINLTKDFTIWVFGQRATAEVVGAWIEQVNDDASEPTFQYFVRYRFAIADGRVVTGTARVGAQEWAGLGMGGWVGLVAGRYFIQPAHANSR